ncbi:MAG: hypothetical protein V7750_06645 [Sneathiella sp.]
MFSQNEKYGQALNLHYGFNKPAQMPVRSNKSNLIGVLKSVFSKSNKADQTTSLNAMAENALDQQTIELAVFTELRNTNSAANENRLDIINGKIA